MERNKTYDVLKGLLIILMVMGHTQFFGHDFVFLFHMGCFFIISGYFLILKRLKVRKNLLIILREKLKDYMFLLFCIIYFL